MAENIVLSVKLSGAEAVIPKLTEIDNLLSHIRENEKIKIKVSAPGLTKAANNAEKLATNLKEASAQTTTLGNQGGKNIDNAGKAAKSASKNAESFNNGLGNVVLTMAKFRLASSAINLVANGFKEAFKEMKAVDSEMVNVRKVTGMSAREMEKLEKHAYAMATQYGRSASDVMEAATVYARAGYTDQIEQLAELTLLLQNAGDLKADEAAKFLIATDAAYKFGGSQEKLIAVIDGLDNITNKNATDMQKLTEGMTVAGSVFAESGESIEMFAALLGATTANTQRSGSEMARGLRTILMNIRQIRGETEDGELIDGESIANASKALKEYANISTMENGELRKASDVLRELAAQWDKLDTVAQSAISEALAGKRQGNVLMSLMGNWELVEKMISEYENAAGTAAAENAAYMDSWAARAEVLKSSWTEFVNNLVDTDLVKGFISALSELISLANDAFTPTNAATREMERLTAAYEKLYGDSGEYAELKSRADELSGIEALRLEYLEKQLAVMEQQIKTAHQGEFDAWQKEYGSGKKNLVFDDISGSISFTTQDLIDLEDVRYTLKYLNEQFANTGDIAAYNAGLDDLREKYADLLTDLKGWEDQGFGDELTYAQKQLLDTFTVLEGLLADTDNATDTYTAAMAAYFLTFGQDAQTAVKNAQDAAHTFENAQLQAQNAASSINNVTTTANSVPENTTANVNVDTNGAEEKLGGVLGLLQQIGNFFMGDVPGLTGGGSDFQVYSYGGYASGTASAPGGPALVNERGPEVISANGLAWIAGGGKPTITMLPRGATVLTASQSRPLLSGSTVPAYKDGTENGKTLGTGAGNRVREILGLDDEEDNTSEYKAVIMYDSPIGPMLPPGYNPSKNWESGGDTGPTAPNFKELEDELSKRLKNLDAQAELAENQEDFLKAMQIYGDAQKHISELLDLYRENGYAEDSDEVLKLANLGYDYASKQLGGYDDLQKRLVDALNALTDATEDANAIAERQEAVDKAREALANAERQRTVRIFNPVTGQWEWVANAGDVEKARESLRNAEQALEKEQLDQTISAIKNAKPEDLAGLTLSPAILDKLFNGTPEQQTAFLNALNAATGGADYLGSTAAQTAFNQGNTIGTQYNLNGIELTQEMAAGMSIKQLLDMLRGLQLM